MPGASWSISAKKCHTGQKLRNIKGTTCEGCYALKNRYSFPNVQTALDNRLEHYSSDPNQWVKDIVQAIHKDRGRWFRWFDSGDLQGISMALDIFEVCRQTPTVKHWLPTREYGYLAQALTLEPLPNNLTIRLSAHMVNSRGPQVLAKQLGPRIQTSGVTTNKAEATCPAHLQNNQCGSCRRCWDARVPHITYPKH